MYLLGSFLMFADIECEPKVKDDPCYILSSEGPVL